jgi:FHS family L-fucose permease-like MFS transporter
MTTPADAPLSQSQSVPVTDRRFLVPFVLITSLFFLWAFGVNLNDILIPHLKKAFGLSDFQSSFIQVAFFGGYFLAAFPAGRLMEKIGYKKGILTGLFLCAVGAVLFLPASSSRIYGFFLFALFVMACGQSFLEVAANPYVTVLGPVASAERRLNFAQSFNAVGAVLSPIVGRSFILTGVENAPAQIAAMSAAQLEAYRAAEAGTVKGPYLLIAAIFIVVAVFIQLTHLPDVQEAAVEAGAVSGEQNSNRVLSQHR